MLCLFSFKSSCLFLTHFSNLKLNPRLSSVPNHKSSSNHPSDQQQDVDQQADYEGMFQPFLQAHSDVNRSTGTR